MAGLLEEAMAEGVVRKADEEFEAVLNRARETIIVGIVEPAALKPAG